MKRFHILLMLLTGVFGFAQSGVLDPSFGSDGIVTTDFLPPFNLVGGTALQADGKILVAGYSGTATTYKMSVVRYNTDGSLDAGFGDDGGVLISAGNARSYATGVAVQPDGKILISGRTWDGNTGDMVMVRLNPDGTLDATFATNGIAVEDSGFHDVGEALILLDNGKILLGGDSNDKFSVLCFNPDGSVDTSFGNNGWAIIPVESGSSASYIKGMALQPDNKVVLTGMVTRSGVMGMGVARINPDGSLDTTFGVGGTLGFNVGPGNDYGIGVKVQQDGKIVIGGNTWVSNNPWLQYDLAIVRLNEDGTMDSSYGTNGVTKLKIMEVNYAEGLLMQEDEKTILIGSISHDDVYDAVLVRFDTDGNIDTTFGDEGMAILDYNNQEEYGRAGAIQTDGKIILAGNTFHNTGSEFFVARFLNETLNVQDQIVSNLSIYPNPAEEFININLTDSTASFLLDIYDMNGRKIMSKQMDARQSVNVSSLAQGVYILKLTVDGATKNIRFIKK